MTVGGRLEDGVHRRFLLLVHVWFSRLIVMRCGVALTFPVDQCAKTIEGEQFEVSQALRVRRANFHL